MEEMMQEEPQAQAGMVIKIACLPDGTFTVSSEALEVQEESGQPVQSIEEALEMAMQMYQSGGSDEEAAFSEGYESIVREGE